MTVSLSGLIRLGFKEACRGPEADHHFHDAQCREPAFSGTFLAELPRLMQCREVAARDQDEILESTIRAYRCGPASLWGPVLLGMLGPALVRMARRLHAQPPAIDEEDLDQQVIVEALRAAALMPLPDSCRFVQRRFVAYTAKRLSRWLERESRRQGSQASIEDARERLR
ncbi:MAG: hypothetical protein M3R21_08975 [Candidatus Dormibacteraeota bacterium]|nr:hypothetical protein [Candidatus Dormibacteraeota bacterium]